MKLRSLAKTLTVLSALALLAGCSYLPSSFEYTDKKGEKKTIYLQTYMQLEQCSAANKSATCEQRRAETAKYLAQYKFSADFAAAKYNMAAIQLDCMKSGKSNKECGVTNPAIKEGDVDTMAMEVEILKQDMYAANKLYDLALNPIADMPQKIQLDVQNNNCSAGWGLYNGGYDSCDLNTTTSVTLVVPESVKGDTEKFAAWAKEQVNKYACKMLDIECKDGKPVTTNTDGGIGDGDPITVIQQFIDQTNQNGVNGQTTAPDYEI